MSDEPYPGPRLVVVVVHDPAAPATSDPTYLARQQAALTTAVYTAWPRLTLEQKHLLQPLLRAWAHAAPPDPPLPKPEPGEAYPGQVELWKRISRAAGGRPD